MRLKELSFMVVFSLLSSWGSVTVKSREEHRRYALESSSGHWVRTLGRGQGKGRAAAGWHPGGVSTQGSQPPALGVALWTRFPGQTQCRWLAPCLCISLLLPWPSGFGVSSGEHFIEQRSFGYCRHQTCFIWWCTWWLLPMSETRGKRPFVPLTTIHSDKCNLQLFENVP